MLRFRRFPAETSCRQATGVYAAYAIFAGRGQGHGQAVEGRKPSAGFYTLKLREQYRYTPDWHARPELASLIQGYCACIERVLQEKPELKGYLFECAHCGIRFFSDVRNAGEIPRIDLRCPFGCREAHRKTQSTRRSVAYYRTEEGRRKKKALNGRRYRRSVWSQTSPPVGTGPPPPPPSAVMAVLGYLCLVLTRIEGRLVTAGELLPFLLKISRQRRIGRDFSPDYLARGCTDPPP